LDYCRVMPTGCYWTKHPPKAEWRGTYFRNGLLQGHYLMYSTGRKFFWYDTWWVSAGYHGKKWEAKCQPSGHFTFQNTIMLDKVPSRYTRNFLPVLYDSREHEVREVQTCFLFIDTIQARWKLTNVIERNWDCNTYYPKNNLHVHFLPNGSKPHVN
jgi:hypothetical protein